MHVIHHLTVIIIYFYFLVQNQIVANYDLIDAKGDDYLIVFPPESSIPTNVRVQKICNSKLSEQFQVTCATKDIQVTQYLYYSCLHNVVEQICSEGFKNISKQGN